VQRADSALVLGSLRLDAQRHLVSNLARRGLLFTQRVGSWGDLSLAAASGRRVVGFSNFTGLQDPKQFLATSRLGLNLVEQSFLRLRAEGSYLYGQQRPLNAFNRGQVTDNESSRGFALRLQGDALEQRLRFDAGFSRSRFDNGKDRQLQGGFDVISVKAVTDDAHYANLEVDILRNYPVGNRFASLSLLGGHERVAPLYRSIGAFVNPDRQAQFFEARADLGGVPVGVIARWSRDNLDREAAILTTRQRELLARIELPLSSLFPTLHYGSALPSLSYAFGRVQQRARARDTAVFAPSAIPDQQNLNHDVAATWFGTNWSFAYRYSNRFQDNRQLGRERDDFRNQRHGIDATLEPWRPLQLRAGYGLSFQDNVATALRTRTHDIQAGIRWQVFERWQVSLDGSRNWDRDSRDTRRSLASTARAQLTHDFDFASWGLTATRDNPRARVFLRWTRQSNRLEESAFAFRQSSRLWILSLGLSVSAFQ